MDNNIFPTQEQEAQRAANELTEIKHQFRDLLNKLNQIEKRLRIIAPNIQTKKPTKKASEIKQHYTDEQLANRYEYLSNIYKASASNAFIELQKLEADELYSLAKYLGCPVGKKLSNIKLIELVSGRLKESKMLGQSFYQESKDV